jgi:low affinity Fe/Cu permease
MGSPWAFLVAFLSIVGWMAAGPILHYSENWQLAINTGTTIVTFLMVFIIQNAQNREAWVMELKLDELIRALEPARNRLVRMDEMSDTELERIESEFHDLHDRASRLREARANDGDVGRST